MGDLDTRTKIETLVKEFYNRLFDNEILAPIFEDVIGDHLEEHLPILNNFWESIIIGNPVYKGNPMLKHIQLHQKHPLNDAHFEEWLKIWYHTVEDNYSGPKAELAKTRASDIARLMMFKIGGVSS